MNQVQSLLELASLTCIKHKLAPPLHHSQALEDSADSVIRFEKARARVGAAETKGRNQARKRFSFGKGSLQRNGNGDGRAVVLLRVHAHVYVPEYGSASFVRGWPEFKGGFRTTCTTGGSNIRGLETSTFSRVLVFLHD